MEMKPPAEDALDHELMAAVARGDGRAFARLVERHLGWSLGFAERMLGARHEAEDLVQTAFLRVWQGAARWEPKERFSTWLYRVLHNLCMDRFRVRGERFESRAEELADESPGSEERMQGMQRACAPPSPPCPSGSARLWCSVITRNARRRRRRRSSA